MYFKYIRLKNLKSLFLMTEAFCEKGSDKYILPTSLYIESIEFTFEAIIIIRASGEVRAEGPNRAAQRTLGKMGIKNQPSAPRPPN